MLSVELRLGIFCPRTARVQPPPLVAYKWHFEWLVSYVIDLNGDASDCKAVYANLRAHVRGSRDFRAKASGAFTLCVRNLLMRIGVNLLSTLRR